MRILVTNDDGIDSVGLHVLARAMREHGDVTIVAPDQEYSGAGASLGALHLIRPEVHDARVDGIDLAWSVSGPPGLCVIYSRLGIFGDPFDLVVSGINPGSNVGRSVYHSGTIGAALTARNGGLTGVAVSQAVTGWGVEGQGRDETLTDQCWDSAAEIAAVAVGAIIADPPAQPSVLNLNVPNLPVDRMRGWKEAPVGGRPPRTLSTARLEPKAGHEGTYRIRMDWGEAQPLDPDTDGGAVMGGWVSLTWLGHLGATDAPAGSSVATAFTSLFA
ncbi:MAG TPA: 5'/3'-nucleotidase SurE [Acidimicrobiales bacterium]|nr:5'/3'-nucleotidase SurE [Acidimicrobiales bacterium]